jgi:hypothetical protein
MDTLYGDLRAFLGSFRKLVSRQIFNAAEEKFRLKVAEKNGVHASCPLQYFSSLAFFIAQNIYSIRTFHSLVIKSFICPTNANTDYFKTVKLLKISKTTIISATCCGLHKPSSGRS